MPANSTGTYMPANAQPSFRTSPATTSTYMPANSTVPEVWTVPRVLTLPRGLDQQINTQHLTSVRNLGAHLGCRDSELWEVGKGRLNAHNMEWGRAGRYICALRILTSTRNSIP